MRPYAPLLNHLRSTYNAVIRSISLPIVAALFGATVFASANGDAPDRRSSELRVSPATRAVVISPHPDDGVLGAGGLVQRIVERRGSVELVEMTSGDAFPKGVAAVRRARQLTSGSYRWYGSLREHEAIQAMRRLGVARSRVRLLGFPDEGLCAIADTRAAERIFASPYTRRDSPPAAERLLADAKYRGADARSELEDLFLAFRPTVIVLPDAHDEHPDHCATHMLVHEAADLAVARGLRAPTFLHYLIHYRDWPVDPTRFPSEAGITALRLTSGELAGKARAIAAYHSQVTVMPAFLRAFERSDERFVRGDEQPTAACWCGGENIAGRSGPH